MHICLLMDLHQDHRHGGRVHPPLLLTTKARNLHKLKMLAYCYFGCRWYNTTQPPFCNFSLVMGPKKYTSLLRWHTAPIWLAEFQNLSSYHNIFSSQWIKIHRPQISLSVRLSFNYDWFLSKSWWRDALGVLVSFMLKQAKWRPKCPALLEYCCLGCSPYKKCTSVLRWHTALIRQKFRIYHPTIIYFHPKGSKSMDLKLHFRSDNYTWSLSKSWWRVCFRTKKDDLKQSKRNSYRE